MGREEMGDFAPEMVGDLVKNLDRIAIALETMALPDIEVKLTEMIEAQKEGFEKIEQIICKYADGVHGKAL